jgi:anti-anti-sigma factor
MGIHVLWVHTSGEFQMNVIESAVDGIPLIVVEGDLDQSSKPAVLDALHNVFNGAYPPQNLLIDLTECAFIDSGGLSVLLTTMARLPAGGWLGIIGASAGPNRVLEYTGFLDHEKVRFFSSRNGAAASVAHERKLLQTQEGKQATQE